MSKQQVWIVVGVAATILAWGYLTRPYHGTLIADEENATVTYFATGGGGGTVPTGTVQPIP